MNPNDVEGSPEGVFEMGLQWKERAEAAEARVEDLLRLLDEAENAWIGACRMGAKVWMERDNALKRLRELERAPATVRKDQIR